MNKVKHFLIRLALQVTLLLVGGCISTDTSAIKTRGVYTTLAVDAHALDLPYSQYTSCKTIGPGQTPAAVITSYGFWDGSNNSSQAFTLQLFETVSGTLLFSQDSNVYYGRVATLALPIRKSGHYQLKLLINDLVADTWDFDVQRDGGDSTGNAGNAPAAYAQGTFGASLEPEPELDAFSDYDYNLMQTLLNKVQMAAQNADPKIFAQVSPGNVVVEFVLHADGSVETPQIIGYTLNDDLGRFFLQSLTNGAPYKPWPAEARQVLGGDTLKIKVTYSYN